MKKTSSSILPPTLDKLLASIVKDLVLNMDMSPKINVHEVDIGLNE